MYVWLWGLRDNRRADIILYEFDMLNTECFSNLFIHDRPKPAKVPAQKHIKLNIV